MLCIFANTFLFVLCLSDNFRSVEPFIRFGFELIGIIGTPFHMGTGRILCHTVESNYPASDAILNYVICDTAFYILMTLVSVNDVISDGDLIQTCSA